MGTVTVTTMYLLVRVQFAKFRRRNKTANNIFPDGVFEERAAGKRIKIGPVFRVEPGWRISFSVINNY